MTEFIVIGIAAFFTAMLTFFSGFGLGTVLMPVFTLFFPVDVAIALTGVVHFTNNLFKMALVGKLFNMDVLLRFGIPAILASLAGAWLMLRLSGLPVLYRYALWGSEFEITPLKLIIAVLLLFFSIAEILPYVKRVQFGRKSLIWGGALSGFFGGLAGIQGALRSAFLIKSGLSKEAYIATGVIIASLVDITRLSVYATRFADAGLYDNLGLLATATLTAIAGALAGRMMMNKVTLHSLQVVVAIMLVLISVALGTGFI